MMLKGFKRLVGFAALLCVLFSVSACGSGDEMDALNQQIKSLQDRVAELEDVLGMPEDDFADDRITVEIKEEFLDRTFTVDDFAAIEATFVKSYTFSLDMYTVGIANKGKFQVLFAVEIAARLEFVERASPNYYDELA